MVVHEYGLCEAASTWILLYYQVHVAMGLSILKKYFHNKIGNQGQDLITVYIADL